MMSRKRPFNAVSAGLLPAESSQFSKSLIRTVGSTPGWSTPGWLMVTSLCASSVDFELTTCETLIDFRAVPAIVQEGLETC
jgi:hypothetical protein